MHDDARMLQVSIFRTLQTHLESVDTSRVLEDVMPIADEVELQLAQALVSYMFEVNADAQPIEA